MSKDPTTDRDGERWIDALARIGLFVEEYHGAEVIGFRHGDELALESAARDLAFVAAPELGGWLALRKSRQDDEGGAE